MHVISWPARIAAALLVAALARDASAAAGIRWISDDWNRAVAEGRKRDALIVVDTWAPW